MLGAITSHLPRISPNKLRNACIALALALMALGSSAGTAVAWDAGAFSADDEQLLFALTNQDRTSAGLNALVNDSYLHKEAEWRAKDMGDRNYVLHAIPPDNLKVFDYERQDGYCFEQSGENIGLSTFDDGVATSRIEGVFMRSQSHRDNILGRWAHLGVGAYKAADGRKLYAVLFSIPCGVSVPTPIPVATPTPVVTPKPVATPTPTPAPRAQATAKPELTAQPLPTGSPVATQPGASPSASAAAVRPSGPAPGGPEPSGAASSEPSPTDGGSAPGIGHATTMRVRERTVSQGPIESFLNALIGGIFGS
jgi:uncharacterized protein YkwD